MLLALYAWGEAHVTDHAHKLAVIDRDTGAEIDPVVVDRHTGRPIEDMNVAFTAGPNAPEPMRARYAGV